MVYSRQDSRPQSPPQEGGALSSRPHELIVKEKGKERSTENGENASKGKEYCRNSKKRQGTVGERQGAGKEQSQHDEGGLKRTLRTYFCERLVATIDSKRTDTHEHQPQAG